MSLRKRPKQHMSKAQKPGEGITWKEQFETGEEEARFKLVRSKRL